MWEPFLCTTIDPCSGINDFEAFVNVSLGLHKEIETEAEDTSKDEHQQDNGKTKANGGDTKDPKNTNKNEKQDDVNTSSKEQQKKEGDQKRTKETVNIFQVL